MNRDVIQPLREKLVEQLTFIDENRRTFMDTYFPTDRYRYEERERYGKLFDRYVSTVEDVIGKLDDTSNLSLPYVLIGSEVSLFYIRDNEEDLLTVDFPEKADPDKGIVSFLSPIGSQLLLCPLQGTVELDTPNGKESVTIRNIKWANWS